MQLRNSLAAALCLVATVAWGQTVTPRLTVTGTSSTGEIGGMTAGGTALSTAAAQAAAAVKKAGDTMTGTLVESAQPGSILQTLTSASGSGYFGATHSLYHAKNGELVLQNNQNGVNTLILENLNLYGFPALVARATDVNYPSTLQNANGSYEHTAFGYGAALALNNRPGLVYWEISRFNGAGDVSMPPTTGAIQQTGGAFQGTPYFRVAVLDATLFTITINGGGNWPSDVNGMTITESGDGQFYAPRTTVVSGQGTPTLTLNNKPLSTNAYIPSIVGTLTYAQYNSVVFRERTSIDFYPWSSPNANIPYMRLDRINGRVGIGAYSNSLYPIASLDVIGSGYFGADTTQRNTYFANAAINILDAGTKGFHWTKINVDTLQMNWNASPSRIDFLELNAGSVPLSISMDGTGISTIGTLRLSSLSGPTQASGSGVPSGLTFNGVVGATAGTPVSGSQYTNTAGASGARLYFYFGGAWTAQASP